LAKVKNFKDEKETVAIAKTPGHRKNRKVIESLPLDWSIRCTASQIYIESYSLCGKQLPDDQHCAVQKYFWQWFSMKSSVMSTLL